MLWRESTLKRVRKCGRVTCTPTGEVVARDNGGVAHFAGVTTCGSVWSCPVCAAKIRAGRSDDVSRGAMKWERNGNTVLMAAFTAPHDMGMRLQPLLDAIANGFRTLLSGRAWAGEGKAAYLRRLEAWEDRYGDQDHPAKPRPLRKYGARDLYGVEGTIRAMEGTYGEHGWHPHLHTLFFIRGELDDDQFERLHAYLKERWARFIVKAGYRMPHDVHGVDLQRCGSVEEAAEYVCKTQDGKNVGNEMARGDMKQGRQGGRTPFEILDDFRWTGDDSDLRLYREWEQATERRKCITWSKGLRKLLLDEDDEAEKSDDELAAEEIGGEDVAVFSNPTWKRITATPGLACGVLDRIEKGGLTAVNELLAGYGIEPARPPDVMISFPRQTDSSPGVGGGVCPPPPPAGPVACAGCGGRLDASLAAKGRHLLC